MKTIAVPGSFTLSDGKRFYAFTSLVETGSRVPRAIGQINDTVGGPVASVRTFERNGLLYIGVVNGNGREAWERAWDPNQDLAEQIELVTIVATHGYGLGETR